MDAAHTTSFTISSWLEDRPPEDLDTLATQLLRRTRELGLALARDDGDVPISTSLTPEILSRDVSETRGKDAARLLSAVIKTARRVLAPGPDSEQARTLFGHLGSFETECLRQWELAEDMAIGRVDWFIDAGGNHRALELNATIPAMEAYSDAAARGWIDVVGAAAGLSRNRREELAERNGSNIEDLRLSLLVHATALGLPDQDRASIAILHRDGDPQLRELQAIARHLEKAGHRVVLATPDGVTLDANGDALVEGRRFDLLYRHIFARRIDPDSTLAKVARNPRRHRLLNPINGHLEVKGLLAVLSRAVDEDEARSIGLTAEEEATVRSVLPWTRLLSRDESRTPDGDRAPVSEMVKREPERFVLKRSWDYGGRSVFIGPDVIESEGRETWEKRVDQALSDGPGRWVAQELVVSPLRRFLTVGGATPRWDRVYADASTFTATGNESVPAGGVVRFHRSRIVNIVKGGGVAPLLLADVANEIVSKL